MRFVLGLAIGLLTTCALLGYFFWQKQQDPCLARCGSQTVCVEGKCQLAENTEEKKPAVKTRRKSRRTTSTNSDEMALRRPSASELQQQKQGPQLNTTDHVKFEENEAGGNERELSSDEVERVYRREDSKVMECIERASAGLDMQGTQVTVGFRVERSGEIKKVTVGAPKTLQERGLYPCIQQIVGRLRLPASGRAQIFHFPYSL